MATIDELYANKIFLNAVLPLVKVVVEDKQNLAEAFKGKNAKIQISAADPSGKVATHFDIQDGQWTVVKGTTEKPDLELEFPSITAFNNFFSGKSKKLPKIKGWYKVGLLIGTLRSLMAMGNLLSLKKPPEKAEDKELLVKLFFYLLSSGISQLNKAEHPDVSKWAKRNPDRIYAWGVLGKPELSAYIRVKAGNTKAARGEYTRSKPFFTMRFDSVDSALGILLQIDNMIEATIKSRIIMEGAPEYGAQIGEFMTLVGAYVS